VFRDGFNQVPKPARRSISEFVVTYSFVRITALRNSIRVERHSYVSLVRAVLKRQRYEHGGRW
jgi:hypothetical protein